jgi:type IV secretion system protein VirB8
MDKINRSILENLYSNSYFAEGRKWYLAIHILPIVERSYMLLLVVIFFIAALNGLISIQTINHKVPYFIVPVTMQDTINYQPVIKPLESVIKETTPYRAFAKYFASKYVLTRESYDYNNIDNQTIKVKNISTNHVTQGFRDLLDLNNPNSPLLRYQKNATRSITIKGIEFLDNDDNNVIVTFEAKVDDPKKDTPEITYWLANISFSMSDVDDQAEFFQDNFYYIVFDYKVQQIKQD